MRNLVSRRPFQRLCQTIALFIINGNFATFLNFGIYQGRLKTVCAPVLNCHSCPLALFACPVGALQYFFMTARFPVYVFAVLALIGVTVGRLACGLLCPFGFLQDLLFRLGSVRIPLPKGLCYIKYVVLVGVVGIASYFLALPAFCKICPVAVLEAGYPHVIFDNAVLDRLFDPQTHQFTGWFFVFKTVLLVAIVLMAVRIKRPFCRMFCPLGALFGLFNRFSILHISIDENRCNSCRRCARMCPVDLDIYKHPDSPECILCMKCTSCPAVSVSIGPVPIAGRRHVRT